MKFNSNLEELISWKAEFFAAHGFNSVDDFWRIWNETYTMQGNPSQKELEEKLKVELFQVRDAYQNNAEKAAMLKTILQSAEFDDLDDFYGELQQLFDFIHSGKLVAEDSTQRLAQLKDIHEKCHATIYVYHAVIEGHTISLEDVQAKLSTLLKDHDFTDIASFYAVYQPTEDKYNGLVAAGKSGRAASFKPMLDQYAELKTTIEQCQALSKSSKMDSPQLVTTPQKATAGPSDTREISVSLEFEDISNAVVSETATSALSAILQPYDFPMTEAAGHFLGKLEIEELVGHYNQVLLNLPECAEKSLSLLLSHFEYEVKRVDSANLTPLMNLDQAKQVLNVLTLQLREEELVNSIVERHLGLVEKKLHATEPPTQIIAEELFNLQKYIRPVDLDLTLELIEKTNQAAHQIAGQDVLLLLGVTGSGKSTTIHHLAGSTLEQTEVEGMEHIAPSRLAKPELESFVSSPFTRSETRNINAVSIDLVGTDGRLLRQVTLCDSPGFGDTEGVEIDIANGIGVARAVRACRSVKPVVLYSRYSMGDRWEGLAKLANIMIQFLPQIKHELSAFTYVFTKFSKTDARKIYSKTLSKQRDLTREDKANIGLVAMLEDILEKTKNEADVNIVDPIHDDPKLLLNKLTSCKAIENPNECFEDYASAESLDKLKEQLVKTEESFKKAFRKGNVGLASYKFYQLSQLNAQLQVHVAKKSYQSAQEFVELALKTMLNRIDTQLHRISQPGNQQMDSDLQRMQSDMHFLYKMEAFRSKYLSTSSNLIELLQQRLSHLLRDLSADILVTPDLSLAEQRTSTRTVLFVSESIASSLKKLKFVVSSFATLFQDIKEFSNIFTSHFQAACEHWANIFSQCAEAAKAAATVGDFSRFVFFAEQMNAMELKLAEYLGGELIATYRTCKLDVEKKLVGCADTICGQVHGYLQSVSRNALDKVALPSAQILAEKMRYLESAVETRGIDAHLNIENLQHQVKNAQDAIVDYFKDVEGRLIPSMWKANPAECFVVFGQLHRELWQCINTNRMDAVFANHYRQIEKRLKEYVLSHKETLMEALFLLKRNTLGTHFNIEYNQLQIAVNGLKNAAAAFDSSSAIYDGELEDIKSGLLEFLDNAENYFSKVQWNVDLADEIPQLLTLMNQVIGFSAIEEPLFNEPAKSATLLNHIDQQMDVLLNSIAEQFRTGAIFTSPELLINAFNFLVGCHEKGNAVLSEHVRLLLARCETKTSEWGAALKSGLEHNYQVLLSQAEQRDGFAATVQNIVDTVLSLYQLQKLCEEKRNKWRQSGIERKLFCFEKLAVEVLCNWLESPTGKVYQHLEMLSKKVMEIQTGQFDEKVYSLIEVAGQLRGFDKLITGRHNYTSIQSELVAAVKLQQESRITDLRLLAVNKKYPDFITLYQELWGKQTELHAKQAEILRGVFSTIETEIGALTNELATMEFEYYTPDTLQVFLQRVASINQAQELSSLPGVDDPKRFEKASHRVTEGFGTKISAFFQAIDRHIESEDIRAALKKISHVRAVSKLFIAANAVTSSAATTVIVQGPSVQAGSKKAPEKKPKPAAAASAAGASAQPPAKGPKPENKAKLNKQAIAQVARETVEATLQGGVIFELIDKELQRVNQRITKLAHDKNIFYSNLPLEDYARTAPIEYFSALETLESDEPTFTDVRLSLHEQIVAKIKRAINECKKEEVDFDIDERISLLKGLHPFIPVSLYSAFEPDLRELEIDIDSRRDKQRRFLKDLQSADNLIGLVDALMKSYEVREMKELSNAIVHLMGDAFRAYNTAIEAGNLAGILAPLNNAWLGWQYYYLQLRDRYTIRSERRWLILSKKKVEHLFDPEVPKKLCSDMLELVSQAYNRTLDALLKDDNKNSLMTLAKELPVLKNMFFLHEDFEDFRRKGGTIRHADVKHLFMSLSEKNPRFNIEQFKAVVVKIKEFFVNNQSVFNEAMNSNELGRMAAILDSMESDGVVLGTFKTLVQESSVGRHFRGLASELEGCFDYNQMRTQLAGRLIELRDTASQKILEHKRAKSSNSYDRKEFYREISVAFSALKAVKPLVRHVDERIADVNILGDEAHDAILSHLKEVADAVEHGINRIPCNQEKTYSELNTWYDNLRLAVECFEIHSLSQDAAQMLVKLDRLLERKMADYKTAVSLVTTNDDLIQRLIQLKLMSIHAPTFKAMADKVIDDVLKGIKKERGGAQRIATIGIELNQRSDEHQAVAQMLIAEHDAFKSYSIELRNEKTLRFGVDYVFEKLAGNRGNTDLHVDRLGAFYEMYKTIYWELVEPGLLQIEKSKKALVLAVKAIAGNRDSYEQNVVQLMAHLFAYWTLMNSEGRDAAEGDPANKNYLLQPHAAQVISIFRLLGIDSDVTTHLRNHLVEIGTGEGKSVTMAVTAAVLAILGFDVDCACYSEYLTQRDYDDFENFFSAFGLKRHITYGTFNKLCENLINQRGDVRNVVIDLLQGGEETRIVAGGTGRERIIIIDEVDVFFSKDFYGNFYRPLAEVRDPVVHDLISYIWSIRDDKTALRLNNVKASDAYVACARRYAGWDSLLEESVKAMIVDVQGFEGQEYVVLDDKIGYREQHGISFDISYRYKTIFAYFCEHEKGEITSSSRDAKVAMLIDCGVFSYAEVPKQYKCIMGVTGTLSTLSPPERNLLESIYSIRKFTYMPSVYGDNQLDFAKESIKGVIITERGGHFMETTNEIVRRRVGDMGLERPVMVFFESNEQLTAYYNSAELQRSGIERDKIKLLTEEVPDDQKPGLIRQAASAGIVTLVTRGFGRGTDFKCFDERINKRCGGVHVLASFVSDELSEETQIKGRTARQGEPGSFSMVLAGEDLERYGLREREIERMKSTGELYSTIHRSRCEFFYAQYSESLRYVDDIKEDHDKSMRFVTSLFAKRMSEIREFLQKRNETQLVGGGSARTIVLMDATGSMSGLITKAKNTVATMFQQAYDILAAKGIRSGFELQFVVYRNYDQPIETLLQCSAWESEPINLQQFIGTVNASGGTWMEEAVEIALWHANHTAESSQVDQVILIGDAPPNRPDQVQEGRKRYKGEAYWKNTEYFKNPTHVNDQVALLQQKGIPVHAFYVHDAARESFQYIASTTGGESEFLDINSPAGAERLTQLITMRILENIGGADLVEAYKEKYIKGYVSSPAKAGMFSKSGKQPAEAERQEAVGASASAAYQPR